MSGHGSITFIVSITPAKYQLGDSWGSQILQESTSRWLIDSFVTRALSQVVAYTYDAGPNAVLIARNRTAASLLLKRLLFYFPPSPDTELTSYLLGDKSILEEAGLQTMKDVENLQAPPEIKGGISVDKNYGSVSYFICTRPGRGPTLVVDEDQALIDPRTGIPKSTSIFDLHAECQKSDLKIITGTAIGVVIVAT
ncbi:hypothetical protein MRB53_034757 [Persea americana]|uniref:Uncharacterized protein n=1 Tax=Persea americana TaxID=3435 RepID=A0ACC2K2Q7_PERAE|nr:hypothetical protein MRB53_034757 [Persea americana]